MYYLEQIQFLNSFDRWEIALSVKYFKQGDYYMITSGYSGNRPEFRSDRIKFLIRNCKSKKTKVVNSLVDIDIFNTVDTYQITYYSALRPEAQELVKIIEYAGTYKYSDDICNIGDTLIQVKSLIGVINVLGGEPYGDSRICLFGSVLLDTYSLLLVHLPSKQPIDGYLGFYNSGCVWLYKIKDMKSFTALKAKYCLMNSQKV